jgi:hypothetical protein
MLGLLCRPSCDVVLGPVLLCESERLATR